MVERRQPPKPSGLVNTGDTAPRARGRAVSQLRAEGKELVDEERLTALFTDLQREGFTDRTAAIDLMAKRAMEILRG